MNRTVPVSLILAVGLLALAGCKDRSQSEKNPAQMPPILASLSATTPAKAQPVMKDRSMFIPLADNIDVSPQISLDQVAAAKAQGVTMIINNRPDGEEMGQPDGAAIQAVAEALGLAYVAIPITHAGFSPPQLDAMAAALAEATGPVLAYCRSGTRSCNLWALAMAKGGADPDMLEEKAGQARYDLSGIRPMLDALAGDR